MIKIVLIGAGSAQFGFDTLGDVFSSRTLEGGRVVLLDINPAALDTVFRTAKKFIADKKLSFDLSATTDRKAALQGADFCISSIEVGDRFALWEQDWNVPRESGIRQVYGENGGPAGCSTRCGSSRRFWISAKTSRQSARRPTSSTTPTP